ncbi:hypothetical protein [Streptomyces sp. NRRL F-5727]|uniref:hypothetical protein n=1 Tax=Streptomyces sp. NRRL F-5727 TaxID=1463871 RepID=UPI0004C56823|nr:hypothetical protein [Streptomyces sp. NRRL F-5727]
MKTNVFLNAIKAFVVAAFAVAATTGLSAAQGDAAGAHAAAPTTQTVATVAGDQDDHGWG